jgi:hypothetical protein
MHGIVHLMSCEIVMNTFISTAVKSNARKKHFHDRQTVNRTISTKLLQHWRSEINPTVVSWTRPPLQ